MVKVNTLYLMDKAMKENGKKAKLKVWVSQSILTGPYMKEIF